MISVEEARAGEVIRGRETAVHCDEKKYEAVDDEGTA
jgi:hypothetical protein